MTTPALQFLSPGVKTQEIDQSAYSKGPGISTAGLIGIFEKGPIGAATLVQSFPEAQRLFGAFLDSYFSMHAIKQAFDQGAQALVIVRTAHYGDPADATTLTAVKATKTLADRGGVPQNTLRVDAISEGAWGNGATGGLAIEVVAATVDVSNGFKLNVYFNGAVVEFYDNLSMDPTNVLDYVENRINGKSQYITVTDLNSTNVAPTDRPALIAVGSGGLAAGDDGLTSLADTDFIGDATAGTGLYAFDKSAIINLLVAPGRTGATMANAMLTYCENRKDVFALIETPSGLDPTTAIAYRNQTSPYSGTIFDSSFGGLFWPWLKFSDPVTGLPRFFPPTGALAGIFSKSDSLTGGWGAAAGITRGLIRQCLGLETDVGESQADAVFPSGVNPLVRRGVNTFYVWGNNTLQRKASATDRINVRRALIAIENTLKAFAQSILFEPNTRTTRETFKRSANAYLAKVKDQQGVQDYFVKCDEENNPADVVEQNRMNIDVYIKPTKTAEFVTLSFTITSQGLDFAETFAQA